MKLWRDERGSIGTVMFILFLVLALFGALGFAFWAYSQRTLYKSQSDKLVATAVDTNTKKVQADDAARFAEEAKNPLKLYSGPAEFGGIQLQYPKTWSGYVVIGTGMPLDGYFAPNVVPSIQAQTSTFALRVQVINSAYTSVLGQYVGFQKQGKASVSPYAFPKVPTVTGAIVDGQLTQNKRGIAIIVPLRDKTLQVWTESDDYRADFTNIILPNLSFSP